MKIKFNMEDMKNWRWLLKMIFWLKGWKTKVKYGLHVVIYLRYNSK